MARPRKLLLWTALLPAAFLLGQAALQAAQLPDYEQQVAPILREYCYDCHADGARKGKVALDEFRSPDERLAQRDLWLAVLRNVRAHLMPPVRKPRPTPADQAVLEEWIKRAVFLTDPADPDPGRVTLRRLNRVEYRNTIRDLMGYDFKVEDELPPDDTGYGFDNIGDVLTVSPMLLEKYMQAAEVITAAAVPRVARVMAEQSVAGTAWRDTDGKAMGDRLDFYTPATLRHSVRTETPGTYRLELEVEVLGQFDFDPGRCRVTLRTGDDELLGEEFGWQNGKRPKLQAQRVWPAGEHPLELKLEPLRPVTQKKNTLDLRIVALRVQGPTEERHWIRAPQHARLFLPEELPDTPAGRRAAARDTLGKFVKRAYRRPVDDAVVTRLVDLAESVFTQPGRRFEDGVAQAMVPVLASPRFLFRVEEAAPGTSTARHPSVDEYALASRLSYFLWSTLPDEELVRLADQGRLRKELSPQIERMLHDARAEALVDSFVGQWLQARDVEGIDINARAVLARDSGEEREFDRRRRRFQELIAIPDEQRTPEQKAELQQMFERRRKNQNQNQNLELDRDLRRAFRRETEMLFSYVLRENRSVLELLESDYTFLNEKLAKHYGLTNVIGAEMRRVPLPEGSPRGGLLTQGTLLIVTSNPTRTSPVKRGLFLLDNILGLPPPPPPPDVPLLEDAEKEFTDRQPTLRETLEIHRRQPLCHSCHNRMDPLGLALENFNAMGMWREKERNQPIQAAGALITGESFQDVRQLKHLLVTEHRLDFYRCLTEKMLTYALGRGLEYYDTQAVDDIVERLDRSGGKMRALLQGVIESAPFQKRRRPDGPGPQPTVEQRAENKAAPVATP
jgi:hypothetical protein